MGKLIKFPNRSEGRSLSPNHVKWSPNINDAEKKRMMKAFEEFYEYLMEYQVEIVALEEEIQALIERYGPDVNID